MSDRKPYKILIVDDEEKISSWLSLLLQADGYDVFVEDNIQCGLRKIREVHPDLLLLDWNMPRHDGLEMLFHLRMSPLKEGDRYNLGLEGKSLPVILMGQKNSWYFTEKFVAVLPFPPDGYITKPFGPRELRTQIKRVLGIQRDGIR